MMKSAPRFALVALLALAGCATTGDRTGPTEVSRYHTGQPIAPGTVSVEPMNNGQGGLEFQAYADAVSGEFSRIGFTPAAVGTSSQYVATVDFRRTSRGTVRTPPKFSIGIGGGGYSGGGVGLGGGVSTGFGSKTRELLVSELFVQLRRRSDGGAVWEGRAQRSGLSGTPGDGPAAAARLANALFRGFPGESGITTSVT